MSRQTSTARQRSTPAKARPLARFRLILRKHLPEIRRRYKVKSLGVFGSYVLGAPRKGSDLDVLVEFNDDSLSLLKYVELEHYLSELVGVKVDLVEKSTLKPRIGRHILATVKAI
jgi:hypothetical protein